MARYHAVICRVVYGVAAGQYNVSLRGAPDIAHDGAYSVNGAPVYAGIVPCQKRGQYKKPVALPVQVPLLAGAEMIHKRVIVALRYNANVGHAGVYKVAQNKVYAAVSSAKRHRRYGAAVCYVPKLVVGFARVDKSEGLFHISCPPFWRLHRSLSCLPVLLRRPLSLRLPL